MAEKVKADKKAKAPAASVTAATAAEVAPNKNEKVGEVVSTKMHKTIVVQVSRRVPHPLYRRIVVKHKKFYVHDEENTARQGDVVRIVECRPLSRLKRWRLADVIRRSALAGAAQPADLDVKI